MKLFEVNSRLLSKEFTRVPKIIYMNDPVWVCPLDRDIDSIFEPSKNAYFKHGDATRWILRDSSGRLIGRVAAFIDFNTSSTWDQPTGGMGFFECIDSPEAAFMLFDAARNWLTERGMEAMDGPINFGETDKYWGLLVNGFTHPTFEVAYNPHYYIKLFESYGFKKFYGMTGFLFDIKAGAPERFRKIAEWITRKPDYEFRHFRWDRANEMMDDFTEVFNQAWASFKKDNFEPLTRDYIMGTLKKARIIIDVEFIWIAYFKKRPVAIFMLYPDANMILKYFKGKMSLINMLRFVILKHRKKLTRIKALLFGVIPEYKGRGLESGFFHHILKNLENKPQYVEAEISWVADYNPPMMTIFESMGAAPAKEYITYRYLFDREKEFKRYPIPV